MTTRLCIDNLAALGDAVAVPNYSRDALRAGIVHFGVGNFHRAHQAVYLDALFRSGRDLDWAVVGAGVMDGDRRMRESLASQDYLTTVVEQRDNGSEARVTGPMIDMLAVGDTAAIVDRLADPAIRIVSLTITEGGYFVDPSRSAFDPTRPEIVADGRSPQAPRTVFGLIAAGLRRRRDDGVAPFTLMSCDNIPHNGAAACNAVTGTVRLSDAAFADWIERNVAFPNGMVDRITPATGERERELLKTEHGIDDAWPVFCEDFTQWVLEDHFPAGRPALEQVGVQFVDDVSAFEAMKIRMLNGGHAVIAYPAALLDIQLVHDAMGHPLIGGFMEKIERDEIMPVVPAVPGVDLPTYLKTLQTRFANPKIADTVQRLSYDGSNRQPKFVVPTIADQLRAGGNVTGLALASALWCRYCGGETESGRPIADNDPNWARLTAAARAARNDPPAWLAMPDVYGDLGRSEPLQRRFAQALNAVWCEGVAATLTRYLDDRL